jgi:hypothetical protein
VKLAEAVSIALRDVHQDLAYADGPAYNFDPGDPRAVDVLLRLLARELLSDVHLIDPAQVRLGSINSAACYNQGVIHASRVLAGEESCSLE